MRRFEATVKLMLRHEDDMQDVTTDEITDALSEYLETNDLTITHDVDEDDGDEFGISMTVDELEVKEMDFQADS